MPGAAAGSAVFAQRPEAVVACRHGHQRQRGSPLRLGDHLLLLGDAVAGNPLYRRYPQLKVNANDDAAQDWSLSRGQYIPTTAIDQVAATLARWMGVTDAAALDAMFPLLSRFAASDLGFMAT